MGRSALLCCTLLVACTASPTDPGQGGADRGGGVDSGGGAGDGGADGGTSDGGSGDGGDGGLDSGDPVEPLVVIEEVPAQDPDVDGWIFDPLEIHEIAITLSDDSWASLYADPYDYVVGQATVMGQPMPDVGVRLRGRIGSFRTLSGKPKLRIDFNQFIDGQRFYGHESLTLNNSVVDCGYLKEPLAYKVFRDVGVTASRTSFAHVTINGADYGLYVLVESPDDTFLDRNFDDGGGNLYDGKYLLFEDGSYQLMDFVSGVVEYMEQEEGTDVGHADVIAVAEAIERARGTGRFEPILDELLDMEAVHRHLFAEQWTGHIDGYATNTNNYWVYFDPSDDGRGQLMPWDMDYGFLEAWVWGLSWSSPRGVLASGCFADAGCAAVHRDIVAEGLEQVEAMDLPGFLADLDAATWDAAVADPRRECGQASVRSYRDDLASWVTTRSDLLALHWGL